MASPTTTPTTRRSRRLTAALFAVTIALASCSQAGGDDSPDSPSGSDGSPDAAAADGEVGGSLLVWADEVRSEMVQAYADSHPEVDVEIVTIPYTISAYQQKLSLQNQVGEGWPDVWGVPGPLLAAFTEDPYAFSADLTDLVPDDFGSNFPEGALDQCMINDRLQCLPYQVSPSVLFYNAPAMEDFGYEVPTTWEEFHELGLRVAEEHPDYSVGVAGGNRDTASRAFLSPAECSYADLIDTRTILSDLDDPNCDRAIAMVQDLIDAGSMQVTSSDDPEYIADYGATDKWLLSNTYIFQIKNLFQNRYETEPGVLGIAPPLRWEDQDEAITGRTGGTAFMVSRHTDNLPAALDLGLYLSTGEVLNDPETVTVPAYLPAFENWTSTMEESGYMSLPSDGHLSEVFTAGIAAIDPNLADLPIDNMAWGQIMVPELQRGKTIEEALPTWIEAMKNEAAAAGYEVVDTP